MFITAVEFTSMNFEAVTKNLEKRNPGKENQMMAKCHIQIIE